VVLRRLALPRHRSHAPAWSATAGLVIAGRKIPDWLLGAAAIAAGLLVARL